MHRRIYEKFDGSVQFEKLTGLVFNGSWSNFGVRTSKVYGSDGPSFEIHSLKLASRVGPSGNKSNQIILSIIQKAGIQINKGADGQDVVEIYIPDHDTKQTPEQFVMSGGVTMIFDLDTLTLNYAISKPLIIINPVNNSKKINTKRALQLHRYYKGDSHNDNPFRVNFGLGKQNSAIETFSFLHTH